jgi:hypothetical protein
MTNNESGDSSTAPELPQGRFEGREAFRQNVRDALACAAREGWRELILSDADFHDWPLGERAVVDSLNDWARSGRTLVMLARSYDEVQRSHPRFVTWRKTWAHIIDCRRCARGDSAALPSLLWSTGWVMRRLDPDHCTGVCTTAPEPRLAARESLKEWLGQSAPGFPVTTLGL